MKPGPLLVNAIEMINADVEYRKNAVYPNVDKLRKYWEAGQQRGKIVIIDSIQHGDRIGTKAAIVVTSDDGHLIRIDLTKDEALNLGRAIIDSVT